METAGPDTVKTETQTALSKALSAMILSHSGWRGIFAASGDEEDAGAEIGLGHMAIAAGAAMAFADYLRMQGDLQKQDGQPVVLLGSDTRPTGESIAAVMIRVLLSCGCKVRYAGFVAAPEIMAWARSGGGSGFVYISASHNPIGHNGLKFGLADGGVLQTQEAVKLIEIFHSVIAPGSESLSWLEKYVSGVCADTGSAALLGALAEVLAGESAAKKEAFDAYLAFSGEVAWAGDPETEKKLIAGISGRPLGLCCDFNGSARSVSIDRDFFGGLGIDFRAINDRPGEIIHRIVPEGESLLPCCRFLEELHAGNPAFVLGYVPDCDGDRGNLVIWDDGAGRARALEAQEVFALACVAELSCLTWANGGKAPTDLAVAVNDPTSLRVDRIAGAFGAKVFRAEVGEANVVGLARLLREKGFTVRILGEGSAGGNITHPSAVRDPVHTVIAIAKLISLRTQDGRPGLFELWCRASGRTDLYKEDFCVADIIASLPPFTTTGATSAEALLKISCGDHAVLKSRYQRIFLAEWERRRDELKAKYGIYRWQVMAYNGTQESCCLADFGTAGRGGLKICFLDNGGRAVASVWMRGSATEPVFRIVADGENAETERDLIEWQRGMVSRADMVN